MDYRYDHAINLNDPNDFYTRIVTLVGNGKTVLDVGCGSGQVGAILTAHFQCRVAGVEVDSKACRKAGSRLWKVVDGDAEHIDLRKHFKPRSFDAIMCLDVLEHMIDPWGFLPRLRVLLAPGGCIVATIPNAGHASVLLELLGGEFRYRSLGLLDRNHLRFFTLSSVTEMFERAGYRIDRLERNVVDVKYLDLAVDTKTFPEEALRFVLDRPESSTYQFIMKAVPRTE